MFCDHKWKFLMFCKKFFTLQIIMWKTFSTWEMWRKSVMWRNNVFVAFFAVFCDLCCFVAKSVLSRFTHFCVEKVGAIKLCLWRKRQISSMILILVVVSISNFVSWSWSWCENLMLAGGCGFSTVSGRVASCIHSGPLKIILQVGSEITDQPFLLIFHLPLSQKITIFPYSWPPMEQCAMRK